MVALVYLIFARGLRSFIKELKHPRRRRRVRRQVKNEFIFYERNSQLSRSVRFVNGSKIVLELNVQWRRVIPNGNTKYQPSSSTFRTGRRIWSFHVVVLQRTAKKCTKIYNARAQPLFCSLNLLFDDVLVAVVVVVCLSSLLFSKLDRCKALTLHQVNNSSSILLPFKALHFSEVDLLPSDNKQRILRDRTEIRNFSLSVYIFIT